MTRMDVRCCCQPQKVLGSLPVPNPVVSGQCVVYYQNTIHADGHVDTLTLPVATLYSRRGGMTLALKAEGVTLETLRTIPEFMEAR